MSNLIIIHQPTLSSYKTVWSFDNEVRVSIVYGQFTYSEVKPVGKDYKDKNANQSISLKNNLKLWEIIEKDQSLKVKKVEIAIFYKDIAIIQECADDLEIEGLYGFIEGLDNEDYWEPLSYVDINKLLDILNWAKNYKPKEA